MNIELPQTRPYDGLFVLGSRLDDGGGAEEIGAIIVKAGYLLTPSGGADTHLMEPDPDAAASALVMADEGVMFADPADGFDVTREADIALYKPLADVVVEGFRVGLDIAGAEVRVNGAVWLTRTEDIDRDGDLDDDDVADLEAASLADRNRHLFGYQPRTENPRRQDADADPEDKPLSLADFDNYSNQFLNFHRRGGGFTAAAVSGALVAGQRIAVRKAGADAFSVTLTHPSLTALYRAWCGHGPDRAPFWTRVRLGAMRADTLILKPDQGRAEVIWRAVWRWADAPKNSYRAVRVSEEGI